MNKPDPQYTIQDRFLDQPYVLAGRLIDPISGSLLWQGKREHLRRKELEVLALLASAEGKQVSRDNFVAVVWQGNDLVGDRGLSNTIVFVRRSLRDEEPNQPLIRTIPRRGYQLVVPVQQPVERLGEQPTPSNLFEAGTTISECPGWRLVRQLSTSPISESWLAEPSAFGERDQGLRVFRFCRSEAHLRHLQREITLLRYLTQSLSDRNDIILIRDWQLDEPPYYLASDYASEGSFYDWTTAGKLAKTANDRLKLMLALTEALAAVHALGVVHRQLSAKTILVDQTEAGPQLKISAFDLAVLSDRTLLEPHKITAVGLTIGVEEATTEATAAEDVHALGIVLMQLALGDVAANSDKNWLERIQNIGLRAAVSRCFGPPVQRPSTSALVAQLRDLVASNNPSTPRASSATFADAVDSLPAGTQVNAGLAGIINRPWTAPLGVSETIGNYKLLDHLGEGGMGTVYLAEQLEPYRKVALKIIRSGLDGKQILSRFEAERQALALMNHPNVTTVLDSGLAADGRPFFAMEYVKGEEITKYCDSHHLNLAARIKLFLQVCDGVLHAHQKGVLHRDIKPSNLMVSEAQDNAGTLKIIDFGLAKSLHGKLALHTLHTSFGAFVGTPIYSSPEHISGAASGVDTRSDVYSMGVVLYELLAGTTPIANKSLENLAPEKLREVVCKSKLPSMREQLQNTSAEKRSVLAEHRSMKFDDLLKTLDSDLSWVVGKCLERDPNDRYASVLELEKDLHRWLENRPVEARPSTWIYRLRKMVRRNRGAAAIACSVSLLLMITTTAAVRDFIRAERALEQARIASEEAIAVAEFQAKQMRDIDPGLIGVELRNIMIAQLEQTTITSTPPEHQKLIGSWLYSLNFADITKKQLDGFYFEPALLAIKRDFADSPLLQARLWHSLADILSKIGQFQKSLDILEPALAIRTRLLGLKHPETLQLLRSRAQAREGLGEFALAETDFISALQGMREVLGEQDLDTLETKQQMGKFYLHIDRAKEAITLLRDTLTSRRKLLGNMDRRTLYSMSNLSYALTVSGQLDEAEKLGLEALEGERRVLGNADLETLSTMSNMSGLFMALGKLDLAEAYDREVLSAVEAKLGRLHPSTLIVKSNLAVKLSRNNRLSEAIALEREALSDSQKLLGAKHNDTLVFQVILGRWLGEARQFSESEMLLKGAIKEFRSSAGAEHATTLKAISYLGSTLSNMGKLAEAEANLREALSGMEKTLGSEHPDTLDAAADLAQVMKQKRRFEDAEKLLTRALVGRRKIFGDSHKKTLAVMKAMEEVRGLREAKLDKQ